MKLSDKITKCLLSQIGHCNTDILVPNFYINTYYEMDLFKLTGAGYVTEYEVKVSKSDFKIDFLKGSNSHNDNCKHKMICEGKRTCNYFYFVVPENLITKQDVPEYCGLIYFNSNNRFDYIKKAPKLHSRKFENYKMLSEKLNFRLNTLESRRMQTQRTLNVTEKYNRLYLDTLLKNNIEIPYLNEY